MVGYALHELTFVLLFLALGLKPLRHKRVRGWWADWPVTVATLGYTFTIARHDPPLLLACAQAVFRRG